MVYPLLRINKIVTSVFMLQRWMLNDKQLKMTCYVMVLYLDSDIYAPGQLSIHVRGNLVINHPCPGGDTHQCKLRNDTWKCAG